RPVFPQIKTSGRLAENLHIAIDSSVGANPAYDAVRARQQELETSFDINNNFPGDKIRELFTQANITFHALLMKAAATRAGFFSEDLDVREVQAQFEDTLRKISRATGGLTVFSNEVLESLKQASAKPDQYYLIVYQPEKGLVSPDNKIEVRVRRENVDIVSLKTRTPAKAGGISIFDFESGSHSIAFRLKGYAKAPLEWKEQGRATINVTLFDDQSAKVFSKETTLDLVADTIRVALDLPSLASGDHFVLIEAYDVVSGEKTVFSQAVRF
ncbi:MAG: hypothetical protein H6P98_2665, partial [Candidatus Aminicenantes bacterium]|nr:hypothetical protein [Candidatus Aminicenantes bacterium]